MTENQSLVGGFAMLALFRPAWYTMVGFSNLLDISENNAEEAMDFYIDLLDNSKIMDLQRYGNNGPSKEGTIIKAIFDLNGKQFICSDSFIQHKWNFTPAISNWAACETTGEIGHFFEKLSEYGDVKMPLDNCGFF